MFAVEADEGCCNSSLSYSLGDGVIQTDILSQKAINPVALRKGQNYSFGRSECNRVKSKYNQSIIQEYPISMKFSATYNISI